MRDDCAFESPGQAIEAGIGMVHQHFMLIDRFTVAENLMLGFEPTTRLKGPVPLLDLQQARESVRDLSERFGMNVEPDDLVGDLPVGVRQRVEILKSLAREARVLILDEPTAVLAPTEVESLFRVMRQLSEEGRTILFITHKLDEVRRVADTVTVIRRGAVVGTASPTGERAELVTMMMGKPVSFVVDRPEQMPGQVVLAIDQPAPAGQVEPFHLSVRNGEIVGVAGVEGNGQQELLERVVGVRSSDNLRVELCGIDVTSAKPGRRFGLGLGYVPEDRTKDGLISGFSIAENLLLRELRSSKFSAHGILKRGQIRRNAESLIEEFDVRTWGPDQPAEKLSGGNQQKILLAREMSRELTCLVVAQPTRGVDVGSANVIHRRLIELRTKDVGTLLVSAELDELLALSDRIVVMKTGRLNGEFTRPFDRSAIATAMVAEPREEPVS